MPRKIDWPWNTISVILDAEPRFTTSRRHLEEKAPQIVTTLCRSANLFAVREQSGMIVAGGVIYPRLGVLVGR